jgi:predicted cupin superfamily sugar epimerase
MAGSLLAVSDLIDRFGLQPHPEGGWYRELHRSEAQVIRGDGQLRSGLTAILFLLEAGGVSRWHRVSGAAETWHFAAGDDLELLILPPDADRVQRHRLGSLRSDGASEPLAVVPDGHWQAARSLGSWSLVSCCVAPGFSFADFSLLRDLPAEIHAAAVLPEFL